MRKLFFLLPLFLFSQEPTENDIPPPEVIEEQLEDAEQLFNEAKKMFNPWYSGPLLTGSAHTLDPGLYNGQAYLFVNDFYGNYDRNRNLQSQPDLVQTNPVYLGQTGIVKGLDVSLTLQGFYNRQSGEGGGGFGDLSLAFGIALLHETPWIPAVKIGLGETFPTGKYQKLNPEKNGIDAIGAGTYLTTFTLNASKVVWWWLLHPISLRLSFNYKVPTKVSVKDFNAYGGGFGTDGKVRPGQTFVGDFALEYSFTKFWAFACDLVYQYSGRTKFFGNRGVDETGGVASVSTPTNDQLSLAPAIEYNPYSTLGFIGGVWFTVYGRNSSAFISGVVSYYQVF